MRILLVRQGLLLYFSSHLLLDRAVSVINAGLLTSAISAGNSFLFSASRILYGLALRDQAPRIFTITDCRGVPIPAVLFTVRGILASSRRPIFDV